MPGSDGLVSCVGGCNSTIFKSRRVHRPLVEQQNQANIHLSAPPKPKECPNLVYSHSRYRPATQETQTPLPPIFQYVPKVKKSRKRRDRKASGAELPQIIKIDADSDDEGTTTKRSRPLAVQFMFWFCGILIVIIGVGVLVYAIVILCTSMEKLTKASNPRPETNTNLMRKFSNKRIGETAGNLARWDTTFPP